MTKILGVLWQDENGFIISAELVLIATLCVIGLIVGLSEIQDAVNNELNDVAEAIGSLNQSYYFHGQSKTSNGVVVAYTRGSFFHDRRDACDGNECDISCDAPVPEAPK
ncbi:MAG: hypothetical protein IT428_09155 [Planctomycetaceae bacterium]|nr:hypothetical protein [Planctomycetaceae bacterium]